MLTVLDLFSGIGGFSLGLERTGGFKTVAFCEVDKFCQQVLKRHWPEVPCYGDIRELSLPAGFADLVCGGFPCQDISVAGKGAGLQGERSGLWTEFARIIAEVGPLFAIIENVPALRTRGADRVLADLEALGYACEPIVVGAIHAGAPHRRQRAWLIAHADSSGLSQWGQSQLLAQQPAAFGSDWRLTEPAICRADDGVPDRIHRLRALGNAVVPQIPELIGRAILSARVTL